MFILFYHRLVKDSLKLVRLCEQQLPNTVIYLDASSNRSLINKYKIKHLPAMIVDTQFSPLIGDECRLFILKYLADLDALADEEGIANEQEAYEQEQSNNMPSLLPANLFAGDRGAMIQSGGNDGMGYLLPEKLEKSPDNLERSLESLQKQRDQLFADMPKQTMNALPPIV